MSLDCAAKPMICEEVFDDCSQPSEEEIRDFAVQIGIDPDVEAHLLPIARNGLMKPLPRHWKPIYENRVGRFYYFNFKTGQSTWEHPLDSQFRQLVKKSRSESLSSAGEEDSKTSLKDELKSFEESVYDLMDTHNFFRDEDMKALSYKRRPTTAHSSRGISAPAFSCQSTMPHGREGINSILTLPLPLEKSSTVQQAFPRQEMHSAFSSEPSIMSAKNDKTLFQEDIIGLKVSKNASELGHKRLNKLSTSRKSVSFDNPIRFDDQISDSGSALIVGQISSDRVSRIDIDMQQKRLDQGLIEKDHPISEKIVKSGSSQPEFTVTGGGSKFLKSHQRDSNAMENKEPSEDVQKMVNVLLPCVKSNSSLDLVPTDSFEVEDLNSRDPFLLRRTEKEDSSASNSQSSILIVSAKPRALYHPEDDKQPLWDMDPQNMTNIEKTIWKQQELEEEKKNVRFDLDKELVISFEPLESLDSESEGIVEEVNWSSTKMLSVLAESKKNLKFEESWRPKVEALHLSMNSNLSSIKSVESLPQEKNSSTVKDQRQDETANIQDLVLKEELTNVTIVTDQNSFESEDLDCPVLNANHQECNNEELIKGNEQAKVPNSVDILENGSQNNHVEDECTSLLEKVSNDISCKSPKKDKAYDSDLIIKEYDVVEETKTVSENKANDSTKLEIDFGNASSEVSLSLKPIQDCVSNCHLQEQPSQNQLDGEYMLVKEFTKINVTDLCFPQGSFIMKNVMKNVNFSHDGIQNPVLADSINLTSQNLDAVKEHSGGDTTVEETIHDSSVKEIGRSDYPSDIKEKVLRSFNLMSIFEKQLENQIKDLSEEYLKRVEMKEQEFKLELQKKEKDLLDNYQNGLLKQQEFRDKKDKELRDTASRLENEYETRIHQLKEQLEHRQKCAIQELKEMHQQVLAAQEVENQAGMLRIREQHAINMKLLREDLLKEEEDMRKEHIERILHIQDNTAGKHNKEASEQISRAMEKLRRERHILENKYRTLKEKYIKLKTELSIIDKKRGEKERKDQFDCPNCKQKEAEQNLVEHDTSSSQAQPPSDRSFESKVKTTSTSTSKNFESLLNVEALKQDSQHSSSDLQSSAPDSSSNQKCVSDDLCKVTANAKMSLKTGNSNDNHNKKCSPCNEFTVQKEEKNRNIPTIIKPHISKAGSVTPKIDQTSKSVTPSPMEALRHQLQRLDELEEQFPASSVTDTYMRYPFSSHGKGEPQSAELEFFRHRIHLEQDLIKRAKCSLQAQKGEYQTRLLNYMQRRSVPTLPSSTLYQMSQEEKELSDLESSLQRTQTLLSEKITHLHSLEKSLQSFSSVVGDRQSKMFFNIKAKSASKSSFNRRWDWKVVGDPLTNQSLNDDFSSDSGGSSGFSSTDYSSDNKQASFHHSQDQGDKFKAFDVNPLDASASISNLNSEISEVWSVLCKRRTEAGLGPPTFLNEQNRSLFSNLPPKSCLFNLFKDRSHGPTSSVDLAQPQSLPEGSTLLERSNNLRHWLQSVKLENPTDM